HVYAVTDRQWLAGRTLESQVRQVLEGGATIVQLREKMVSDDEFLAIGRVIQTVCREFGVPFIINDNLKVAAILGAGLHVGQSDAACADARRVLGENAILGVSCTTVEEALRAEAAGADYLGVGAVFPTSTKSDADYVDRQTLIDICGAVRIPVVAIGGISLENAPKLAGTGIAGVAVVSALFAAENPREAAREFTSIRY
ncbi:MAG: thiamine phosphate synthase, partial [Lentisphaeria bacterium]|nr:thiamine phosphate synthase [Lentisphaeria bacterium]